MTDEELIDWAASIVEARNQLQALACLAVLLARRMIVTRANKPTTEQEREMIRQGKQG